MRSYCETMQRSYGCMALVHPDYGDVRGCGRWGHHGEIELPGQQPLCHQHRDRLETDLQRRHHGVYRFITPHVPSLDLVRWPEYRRSCWALVDADHADTRCGATTELIEVVGRLQPPDVSLCTAHADAVTAWLLAKWEEDRQLWRTKAAWGWQVAAS